MRVLVTGGAGLIGSHIVDRLIDEGAGEIRVLDNLVRGRSENLAAALVRRPIRFIEGDVRSITLSFARAFICQDSPLPSCLSNPPANVTKDNTKHFKKILFLDKINGCRRYFCNFATPLIGRNCSDSGNYLCRRLGPAA